MSRPRLADELAEIRCVAPAELVERLDLHARRTYTTRAAVVRQAVALLLDQEAASNGNGLAPQP